MTDNDLFPMMLQLREAGTPAALATVVHTRGHCPREVGAKMLVLRDGRTFGTIGGGCGEAEVRLAALQVIDGRVPRLYLVDLLENPAMADGAVCGGRMEVFIERVRQ